MTMFTRSLSAALLGSVLMLPAVTHAAHNTAVSLPTINLTMNATSIMASGAFRSGAVDVHAVRSGRATGGALFVRLLPGVTPQQLIAFLHTPASQDPNRVASIGSIVLDAESGPGTSDVQTVLQPGNYVAFYALDNKQPNGWPHTTFTVTQASQPAMLPAPAATISIIEFGFRGPATFHVGETVRVVNNGYLVHMATAFGVPSLAVGNQVMQLLRAGKDNQAQKLAQHTFFAFAGPISHGAMQQLTVQGTPGYYVLACFMDTQDGREHTQLGMYRLIQLVR